jgi:hypothetical protein
VRPTVVRLAASILVTTIAAATVLATGAVRSALVLQLWALALAAETLLALVRLTRLAHRRTPRTPLGLRVPRRAAPRRPPELESLERVVSVSTEETFFFERRLLPLLREIAEHRLVRRGVHPDSDRARELLGAELAALLDARPERPLPLAELRAHLDALERI